MKKIKLNKGKYTIVDDKDFNKLNKLNWFLSDTGYAISSLWVDGKTKRIRMHREILNAPKGKFVDHINNDKLDNRRSNLRLCSNAENMRNRKAPVNNSSGFKGVHFHSQRNKWVAKIKVFYQEMHLGSFDNKLEAAEAYNIAAKKYFGEFAFLNKINNYEK